MVAGSAVLIGLTIPYAIACLIDPAHLSDFEQFYAGGWILRLHMGSQLYNFATNVGVGVAHTGFSSNMYVHPSFEALLYYPFAFLPFRLAYCAYCAFNFGLLYFVHRTLRPYLNALGSTGSWLQGALYLSFLPIPHAIFQGQDSVLFLLLIALSFARLSEGDLLAAGFIAGFANFRFQNALFILALFIVWRMWKFVAGFLVSGSICVLSFAMVSGWRSFIEYVKVLTWLDGYLRMNSFMVSLRGVLFASGVSSKVSMAVTAIAVFAVAAWRGRDGSPDKRFLIAIVAMCLASFHMFVYDLAVLIVPILMLAEAALGANNRWLLATSGLFLASPTVLFTFLPASYSWTLCAMQILLFVACSERSRGFALHDRRNAGRVRPGEKRVITGIMNSSRVMLP